MRILADPRPETKGAPGETQAPVPREVDLPRGRSEGRIREFTGAPGPHRAFEAISTPPIAVPGFDPDVTIYQGPIDLDFVIATIVREVRDGDTGSEDYAWPFAVRSEGRQVALVTFASKAEVTVKRPVTVEWADEGQAEPEPEAEDDEPDAPDEVTRLHAQVAGPIFRDVAESFFESVRSLESIDDEDDPTGFWRGIAKAQNECARFSLARMCFEVTYHGVEDGDEWETMAVQEDFGPHFLVVARPGRDVNGKVSYWLEDAVVDVILLDGLTKLL